MRFPRHRGRGLRKLLDDAVLHDGISFEKLGKPALVICTEPFKRTAQSIARVLGVPDYPFALVEHPIEKAGRGRSSIVLADRAYRQGVAILTGAERAA